jgi:hypothetical protein
VHLPHHRGAPGRARSTSGAALLAGVLLLTGCTAAPAGGPDRGLRATSSPGTPSTAAVAAATAAPAPAVSARPVAALEQREDADVLVVAPQTLPADARERLTGLSDPSGSLLFSAGTLRTGDRPVAAVGVDPSTFRAFTAAGTAESDQVWESVARGEAVVSHEVARAADLRLGATVPLRGGGTGAELRLGALATTGLPRADVVLAQERAGSLGLPRDNALLLTAPGGTDPVVFAAQVREVAGSAAVDLLQVPAPVARLTGGEAAEDLGAFSYRYFADGTIEPDARWVRDNIRTEQVPVLGRVTCHRLMLPQLRGALQEVQDAGLAGTLKTYDGCYVPRFIERNPQRSISLHTWGIAIDMDAATNYRGIRGTMDARVVEIFKRWGFAWGGDWQYTDPMHFELTTILSSPRA